MSDSSAGEKAVVVIAGAGPAGLTAAYELLQETDCHPLVLEKDVQVGGICKTVQHNGNRMDIGGHRFFSKSDWVMDWWSQHLAYRFNGEARVSYQNKSRLVSAGAEQAEGHMLLRPRLSRIYFLRKFFDYPVKLNLNTVRNLGPLRMIRIGFSYLRIKLFPIRPERNLQDFFVNRFGWQLYRTFFKDYTEKVWGVSCTEISAEWGAQRIKALSITRVLKHALRSWLGGRGDYHQRNTETSLIEQFLYPEFGPGQLWEIVADKVRSSGGVVALKSTVVALDVDYRQRLVRAVSVRDSGGQTRSIPCDYFISSMPVRELVGLFSEAPAAVKAVADGLMYRDFITVGVLVRKLKKREFNADSPTNLLPDNWVYIQEPDVKLGRLQIFNNWSPSLVSDSDTVWLGLEYFCNEGDELWQLSDAEMAELAIAELVKLDLAEAADVLDHKVVRVEKAYPAYFGSYDQFDTIRDYLDGFENLYLVGRNGMHRYNNQDHSMLTARLAVESIRDGGCDRSAMWSVNVDDDYHEEKTA